jgi:hypothetical protein
MKTEGQQLLDLSKKMEVVVVLYASQIAFSIAK